MTFFFIHKLFSEVREKQTILSEGTLSVNGLKVACGVKFFDSVFPLPCFYLTIQHYL